MIDPLKILKDWLVAHSEDLRTTAYMLSIPVDDLIITMLDDALDSYKNFAMLSQGIEDFNNESQRSN